jgi:hypothetical protein
MASKSRAAKTATEGVKILWEDKFFRTWRRLSAVDAALAKRDNHFSPAALDMSLKRAAHLTRRRKSGGYEYIQRYPFIRESESAPAEKRSAKK